MLPPGRHGWASVQEPRPPPIGVAERWLDFRPPGEVVENKQTGRRIFIRKPQRMSTAVGGLNLPLADDARIDSALVSALYEEHSQELRRFLIGVLRDHDLATDALQNAFSKMIEVGHTARQETLKGWLFRVAYHEALALRRRQGVDGKAMRKIASAGPPASESPDELLCRSEAVDRVRDALEQLPAEQRQVVRMRMYRQQTFAAIAAELGLPLGTVLTRMKLAVDKLRLKLAGDE